METRTDERSGARGYTIIGAEVNLAPMIV